MQVDDSQSVVLSRDHILLCIILLWNEKMYEDTIPLVDSGFRRNLSDNIRQLTEIGYICRNGGQLFLTDKVEKRKLVEHFLAMPFPENYYFASIYIYYRDGLENALIFSAEHMQESICRESNFYLKYNYDLFNCFLLEYRASIHDNEKMRMFINAVIHIYHVVVIYPFDVSKCLMVLHKAKGYTYILGDERSRALLELFILNILVNSPDSPKRRELTTKYRRSIRYIRNQNDESLKNLSMLHMCAHIFMEGRLMESFQIAVNILHEYDSEYPARQVTQAYIHAVAAAYYLGEFHLCGNFSNKSDITYGTSTILFLAHLRLLQEDYDEFFCMVRDLGEYNVNMQVYSRMWKSTLMSLYYINIGEPGKAYKIYSKIIKPLFEMGLFFVGGHLVGSFFLEIFYSNYIHFPTEDNWAFLESQLKKSLGSCSRVQQCCALRIQGQLFQYLKKAPEESIECYTKALAIAQDISYQHEIFSNCICLAQLYQTIYEPQRSSFYAIEARRVAKKYNFKHWPKDLDIPEGNNPFYEEEISPTKKKFLLGMKTQIKNIRDWSNSTDYIHQVLAVFSSYFGALTILYVGRQGEEEQVISNRLAQKPTEEYSRKMIHDSFEKKECQLRYIREKSNACSITLYLEPAHNRTACIYMEGSLFLHVMQVLSPQMLERIAVFISDCLWFLFTVENRTPPSPPNVTITQSSFSEKQIHFQSAQMQNILNQIAEYAKTDANILILGESGVGKELLAKRIHEESGRKGPFVPVNLANIPESLYESELHGYEKGAFTHALKQHIGLFELAHEGTLFIDEVGDIPLALQLKLLRVLQEKQFTRIGSTKMLYSSFRLIAATNRNLKAAIQEGSFREDLFYRLCVIPLQVPPLRERPDDIRCLVEYFLNYFAVKHSKKMRPLTEDEKSFLLHYTWPGNIRELKNIMERYVILNDMENRLSINNFISTAPLEKTSSNPSPDFFQALPSLKQLETEYLEYVFRKTHGKVDGEDGMGTILGLSRQQVYLRIKQAGIRDKFKKGYFKENPR